MANFRNRPHLENRQMVQHSGAILNLSGQTVFEQGLYDTYFYNSYEDFLNGVSGGTGYLNLIATSGDTDSVSGYSEHISYQPGKLVLKPARGVIFSGNTNIVSGYTAAPDVTNHIITSIDSNGTMVWTPLSAITSGSCVPSFSVQTIVPCSSGGTVTVDGNFKVEGNFTVIGTTTSATTIIETETVRVEDNNIELNYGGNHTTAIGGGITVLSGVSNSQDSRIYTLSDGTFMFEPGLSATTITLESVLSNGNSTGNYNIHVEDGYAIGSNVAGSFGTGIKFNDKEFVLRTVDGTLSSPTYGSSEIYFSTTGLTVGQAGLSNVGIFRGIEYKKDFSSNYTNRSLVDKEYVDGLVSGGTISGSGTTNQITYWDSTSSITSDTGFTWDGSTMKITKNSTVGGIIIDTSGDPSPASFSDKYQAAFILTESSNNDYDPTDLNSTLNTLSIGTVGSGFQTQGKIGPGIAFTFADDNSTGGANAAIRMVKSDTDIFGQTEDGALLVFGTREADNGGGGADVKESIRIGHNQYVGINYTPDNSTNPGAMLTLGTNAGDDATLAIREISGTPVQITNYGQFYVKSSDSKPYFKDSSGTEYDISTGTGGGVTIDPYNDLGNVNTTQTWDVSGTSTNYELTLTGSITLNLNNVRNGDYGTLIIEQDGVGSHTLAFGTVNGGAGTHKVVNGGGGSPTLTSTPNAIDLLSFTYNGTTMYWSVGNDYT